MAADDGRREGAGRIHGGAADRSGKHGFERNDSADGQAGGDALFTGSRGDAEDDEHEQEGEHELEDEALAGGAVRNGGAERGAGGEEKNARGSWR